MTYDELLGMCARTACMSPDFQATSLYTVQAALNHHDPDSRGIIAEKIMTLLLEHVEQLEAEKRRPVRH